MQYGFTWTANGDESCHFISGNSIQTRAVDDSEASFFPSIKYANCVASPSVRIAIIGSFGR